MKQFVILACIASCALNFAAARPDVSLGYHYHPGHSSAGANLLQTPSSSSTNYFNPAPAFGVIGGSGGGGGGGSFGFSGSQFSGSSGIAGGDIGGASSTSFGIGGVGGSGSYSSSGSSYQSDYNEQINFSQQAPIITKHFYIHNAPEDHDEQEIVRTINIGRPQKNYHVVFVNTPSSSASRAKIIANVAPHEEKTAVYVLAKKANALDVSAEVVTPAPVVNKPDVFFIKYKTPEEAVHAQHTIQAQYDALGGSTDVVNGGNIPVSSVIGSLGGASESVDFAQSSNAGPTFSIGTIGETKQNYLPPNHK